MSMKLQMTCHLCGMAFDEEMLTEKLSDEYIVTKERVEWQYKKYCSGDGTLRCAEIDSITRRGAMYEAWLDDPNIIDACDA